MLNKHSNKTTALLSMLGKVKPRKKYYLYIASCYFTTKAADKLISSVKAKYPVEETYIFIDRKTALSIGKDALERWVGKYGGSVGLYPVCHSSLFHTKGYALVSFDADENVVTGSLVIGSANLSGSGLVNKNGNIETLIDTQNKDIVIDWINGLEKLDWIELEDLEVFDAEDDTSFQYAMLMEGEFIHPWSGDLRSLLVVKYSLSDKGKSITKTPDSLSGMGFDLDSASISKSYIDDFPAGSYLSDEFKNLKRNYGIECRLGYWIPKNIFSEFFRSGLGFDQFKCDLLSFFNQNKTRLKKEILDDYNKLLSDGFIDRVQQKPDLTFEHRFSDLLDNEEKLMRLYSRLSLYPMPYGIGDSDNICSLYEEIVQTANEKKKKNKSQQAWLNAVEAVSIDVLRKQLQR